MKYLVIAIRKSRQLTLLAKHNGFCFASIKYMHVVYAFIYDTVMGRVRLSTLLSCCLREPSHVLRHTTLQESARFTCLPVCSSQTQHLCIQMHIYTGITAVQLVTHYVIYKRVIHIFYIPSMIIYRLQYLFNVAYISLF